MSVLWFQVYEARFGKRISEPEIAVWEEEVAREVRNLGAGEIIDAVRRIAEARRKTGEVGKKYAPTCEDLITEIIRGKWQKTHEDTGGQNHTLVVLDPQHGPYRYRYSQEPERSWKSRLHGADPVEAWEIICEPCNPQQCRERESYCASHGIEYEKFMPKVDVVAGLVRKMAVAT